MSWARIAAGRAKPAAPPAAAPAPGPANTDSVRPSPQAGLRVGSAAGERGVTDTASGERAEGRRREIGAGGEGGNGVIKSAGGGRSEGEGGEEREEEKKNKEEAVLIGQVHGDRANGSAAPRSAPEAGEGSGPNGVSAEDDTAVDVVDAAAVEAAQAAAKAEAAASAAAEAAALAEQTWTSLLGMLGREDGLVAGTEPAMGDLVHRGLVNTGNSCFRSAVLQALLGCEPFVR